MDWLVFNFYRLAFLPFIYGLTRLLSPLNIDNKLFEGIRFRLRNEFHYSPTFNPDRKSIGIHAASGEIEYAYPVIRKFKELHPNCNIVVTLSSSSVLKAVINQPEIDAVGPAPIDTLWLANRFLKKFNFIVFLFARTDVWPEISRQLKNRKIPCYLFSATFSEKSAKKGNFANSLTRTALNNLDKILTVSDSDKKNFEFIQVKTPTVKTGDTRYDQVFYKKLIAKKNLPEPPKNKKTFVAGSTWPQDEAVLLPAFANVSSYWNLVIAPHEVHEETLLRIENFCLKQNLNSIRLSKLVDVKQTEGHPWDVLVVDKYGYLFFLYGWAHLAFVGGSFKEKVHSVMEPLSFFKPVCVGPYYTNNREAIEFGQINIPNQEFKWVQPIQNKEDLSHLLSFYASFSEAEFEKLTSNLSQLIVQLQNSTDRTIEQFHFPKV